LSEEETQRHTVPPEVDTVFFDAGNTLLYLDLDWIAERLESDGWEVDADALFYGQCRAAYEASRLSLLKKYPSDADRFSPYFSRILELTGIPRYCIDDCVRILREEHERENLWRVVPEAVPETLGKLSGGGYALGVISNSDGRLGALLEKGGLSDYFGCVLDSAEVGVEKPDPEIFRRALQATSAKAASCVYVGDIYAVDIAGATRAGLTGVLLDPFDLHGEFDCLRVADVKELPALLSPAPQQ